jgi:asparagine synthase (glutamine-hydrolysing)
MCGICGIYNFKNAPVDKGLLKSMTTIMKHRGPDGSGFYLSGNVGMGHRRLSIIDVEGGGQPIANEDGNIHVVFNGEIYNYIELKEELLKSDHRFKTQSDTEVIVHAYEEWGEECVNRFNGIFAIGLWDNINQTLFLARDHLGVKPLYYHLDGERFIFASEIKSLLIEPGCPREVNLASLARLFTFRYVPSPDTMFRDIRKIPPGHALLLNSGGMRIKRYWNWKPTIRKEWKEARLVEEYQSLLEDAIRLQIRSDVPVGLFLSSGIDSGSILAIMRNYISGPIYTFTIGFHGGERTNETEDARNFARKHQAIHSEMMVGPEDYKKYHERYLYDIEEPVGNETVAPFYFVSKIASEKVKVALSGQGADEPWAGYHRYIGVKLSKYYSQLPNFLTDKVIKNVVSFFPRNERLKRGVQSLGEPDVLRRFVKIYSFFSDEMKSFLFREEIKKKLEYQGFNAEETLRPWYSDVEGLDPVSQMLYMDTRTNLPDDLLMVNDKTSMANSIEARVPFLDYRIVMFIESLPPELKLNGFEGKYLHKKAVSKWLPQDMIYKKKKGFANPMDLWLRDNLKIYAKECLFKRNAAINHYFDRYYIRKIFRLHEEMKEEYMRQIYLLISFEMWHQRFISNKYTI